MIDGLALAQTGVCDPAIDGYTHLKNFRFIKAFTCTYAVPMGFFAFAMLVYGGIALSNYVETGSPAITVVLTLLIGGAVLSQMASVAVQIALLALLTVGAGAFTYIYYFYSR